MFSADMLLVRPHLWFHQTTYAKHVLKISHTRDVCVSFDGFIILLNENKVKLIYDVDILLHTEDVFKLQ